MIRSFKFFHGYTGKLRTIWNPPFVDVEAYTINPEQELTQILSDEIARQVDSDVLDRITRLINGGGNQDEDYLNRWMNIGNRA